MKKDPHYLLHLTAATLLLAAWLQIPFLLHTVAGPWAKTVAVCFNGMNAGLGVLAFLLLFSDVSFVVKLGCASSLLLTGISAVGAAAVFRATGSLPWTLWIPLALNLSTAVVFIIFWTVLRNSSVLKKGSETVQGVALFFLALGFSVVLIEWGCRTASSPIWSEASDWRWYALKVQRNEFKFRGPPLSQFPPNAVRVLILGDSFTLGYKVDQDKIFTTVLQKDWTPPPPLAIFNGSQVNWSIEEEEDLYDHLQPAWSPQVVVVAHVLNDISPDSPSPLPSIGTLWAIYNLYAYRFIRPWMEKSSEKRFTAEMLSAYSPQGKDWARYFQHLEQLRKDVTSRGGRFGVMIFPWIVDSPEYPFLPIHAALHRKLDEMGIPYIDLLEAYHPYTAVQLRATRTDAHPGPLGHQLAARALAGFIRQRLLPKG